MKNTNSNATTRRRRASEANRRRHVSVSPAADSTEESPQTTRHTVRTTKKKEGLEVLQPTTFPYKLREMLEHASSCDSAELQSACFWSPDGTAFVISNTDVVMEELVPMFFKQTKFRSFVSLLLNALTILCVHFQFFYISSHNRTQDTNINLQTDPILLFLLALSNRHDS